MTRKRETTNGSVAMPGTDYHDFAQHHVHPNLHCCHACVGVRSHMVYDIVLEEV